MHNQLKILIVLLLLNLGSSLSAQSLMLGAGGSYGSGIKQFAPNVRLYYGVSEAFCFGPEFAYFPYVNHEGQDLQLSEYCFVAHYIFEIKEKAGFFPLFGINYSVERERLTNEIHFEKALGLALGVGLHFNIGNFLPFSEYKYITGDLNQVIISTGIIYNLDLSEK